MILVDTGPLVALFDPRDDAHHQCRQLLRKARRGLVSTLPVLTEAFHLLSPASPGSVALQAFVVRGGLEVEFLAPDSLRRAFALMAQYADHPMDLADASLVVTAELRRVTTVFTLDRGDFSTYRALIGRTPKPFRLFS